MITEKIGTSKMAVLKSELMNYKNGAGANVFDEIPDVVGHHNNPDTVLKELEKKYGTNNVSVWANYPVQPAIPQPHSRLWYQWFCYGYLYFYDVQVKGGNNPHTIHFLWLKGEVVIFITPPTGELEEGKEICFIPHPPALSDPPPPPPPPPPPLE